MYNSTVRGKNFAENQILALLLNYHGNVPLVCSITPAFVVHLSTSCHFRILLGHDAISSDFTVTGTGLLRQQVLWRYRIYDAAKGKRERQQRRATSS